jgi:HD-like signal output (HDOD) protein
MRSAAQVRAPHAETAVMLDLHSPLRDLDAWTATFRDAEIPVLAETAEALEALRVNEDAADANLLAELTASDPLMSLKVMTCAAANRHSRLVTDAETIVAALVMMGITPFFRAFGPQPTVESRLQTHGDALAGLQAVLKRSHRAARFALGFAVHRNDHDAALIHLAALLHDFAELLLWCHAPALALGLQARLQGEPGLRSIAAQREMLHVELPDLQQALMKAWRLPELLVRTADDRHADHPRVQTVKLAIQLARHTAAGWDNPALPDDVTAVARLLNLACEPTLALLQEIDA